MPKSGNHQKAGSARRKPRGAGGANRKGNKHPTKNRQLERAISGKPRKAIKVTEPVDEVLQGITVEQNPATAQRTAKRDAEASAKKVKTTHKITVNAREDSEFKFAEFRADRALPAVSVVPKMMDGAEAAGSADGAVAQIGVKLANPEGEGKATKPKAASESGAPVEKSAKMPEVKISRKISRFGDGKIIEASEYKKPATSIRKHNISVVVPEPETKMTASTVMTEKPRLENLGSEAKETTPRTMVETTRTSASSTAHTPISAERINGRMRARGRQPNLYVHPTAQQLKDAAIKKAMQSAERTRPVKRQRSRVHFGLRRVILAMACAAAAVFAIVYFVNLNSPDISLKVAAMQTGIDASYPSYVPRDYNLSDITSENGKITLNFKNNSTGSAFTLVEEQSSWDSNALYENYIREAYGDDYTLIREQGLALYISGSDAAWVNGGVVYKLKTLSGSLTKKQIKAIAVSL